MAAVNGHGPGALAEDLGPHNPPAPVLLRPWLRLPWGPACTSLSHGRPRIHLKCCDRTLWTGCVQEKPPGTGTLWKVFRSGSARKCLERGELGRRLGAAPG